MISLAAILLLVIGVAALMRFLGFAELTAALVSALAAIWLATPFDASHTALLFDFGRIASYANLAVMVSCVIAALLAGCHAAPRPHRPLGWYAAGDAGFVGVLLVAIVLGADAFEISIFSIMPAALVLAVPLWLAMAGAGALAGGMSSAKAPVGSIAVGIGIGVLAIAFVVLPGMVAIALGIATPFEAFASLGLPAALLLRLLLGLIQGRGVAGYGSDLLRGIADGAWIALVVFAARMAHYAIQVAGILPVLPLSPTVLIALFALAVLVLGVLVGPTYGALTAVAILAPSLTAAHVSNHACALALALALMLGYARPALGLTLLSRGPVAFFGRVAAAEVGAMTFAVVIVVAASAVIAAMGSDALQLDPFALR